MALAAGPEVAPIGFENIASRAGVDFVMRNSATPNKLQPEAMIAGVAIFDYDGDGYPDLYFVNGANMPSLVKDGPEYKNRLFHNNGNLTFTDVTDKAGVGGSGYGMGVAVGDYDNDGHPDLYVVNVNGNQLFHNNGDGTFTDVTQKAGVEGGKFNGRKMWSVSAAWVDYNNDGLLDLFVSNYCQWDVTGGPACIVNGHRAYCSPRYFKPLPNTLYRNNGDGTFTDVSAETGIAGQTGRGMGIGIADYDGDGYQDIFVANDNSPGELFHNIGGKRFQNVAEDAMVAYSAEGNILAGMGVGFADVSNNGRPSLWVTAVENQTFPLFVNLGGGQFADESAARGLAVPTARMSGWSNAVVDLDNDGWKDLVVARSNVLDNIELFAPRKYQEPNAIFRNLGDGKFADVTIQAGADFQIPAAHRGLAYGDLDNDGKIDLVVSVLNGPAEIFHNVTQNRNHSLTLQLIGTKSNRMAIGAQLKLTTTDGRVQYNHVSTSTGYACSSDPRVHFGLGASTAVKELEIRWPSGRVQLLRDIVADRLVKITEPN
jgi:enediyne biosynthesis protein E4